MGSKCGFTYKDYDGQLTSTSFDIVTVTAANFDATNTAVNALSSAILAIQTENALQSKRYIAADNFISRAKATEKDSQASNRWILTIEDATTHRLATHAIGLADVAQIGTDVDTLDLSQGTGDALKTAVEAVVKFPGTLNAVNLVSVHYSR